MNAISPQHLFRYWRTICNSRGLFFFSLTLFNFNLFQSTFDIKTGVKTFISNYFITFYSCHYTVLSSPGVDILSNLNYFPVPRVGILTKKLQTIRTYVFCHKFVPVLAKLCMLSFKFLELFFAF